MKVFIDTNVFLDYILPQFGIKISFKKFGNLNYFSYLCRC